MPEPRASANQPPDAAARRRAVLRTAWIVAGIALLVYLAFLLSGLLQS
jgi:predicted secreted protein